MNAMDTYKRNTRKIINQFLGHRIGFAACIASLEASLAKLIPELPREQLPGLRVLLLANNETVMKEMEKNGSRSDARI